MLGANPYPVRAQLCDMCAPVGSTGAILRFESGPSWMQGPQVRLLGYYQAIQEGNNDTL